VSVKVDAPGTIEILIIIPVCASTEVKTVDVTTADTDMIPSTIKITVIDITYSTIKKVKSIF
jgi:hypothetical protein